ncbi:MAG: hypothetical protein ACREMY_02345 [bacterium]
MELPTHQALMRLRGNPDSRFINAACEGVCVPVYTCGMWTLFRCRDCQALISAYDGQAHEWNYVFAATSQRR